MSFSNNNISASIKLLDELKMLKKKADRLKTFLRHPEAKETPDWYMCVPYFFNLALDIKITTRIKNEIPISTLTQGPNFSFQPGDIIYDTIKAYSVWSEALKYIQLCVQIIFSTQTEALTTNIDGSKIKTFRNPGKVLFSILLPNHKKTNLVKISEYELSQDDFLRFLIAGPDETLNKIINEWKQL